MKKFNPPPGSLGRVANVAETFFTEVSVLLFVFPVLDEYVQYGGRGVTRGVILWSLGSSAMSLLFAGVLAIFNDEDR